MINGVEILNQCIIYRPTKIGIIVMNILLLTGLLLFFCGIRRFKEKLFCIGGIIFSLGFIIIFFVGESVNQTFLNEPNKIQYTIEIKDDSAWKEIGQKYIVKEKLFENKEIYLIEGDYINDNT